MPARDYGQRFYRCQQSGSRRSAEIVVPLLMDIVRPVSVIDVGCGVGTWLSVFRDLGVEDVQGVDGNWVQRDMLKIPPERFLPHDLTQPLKHSRTFDLVVSLEVAGHLPRSYAEVFVDSLSALGPAVFFSAGIPCQAGQHHMNLQWPEYWAKLFGKKDFVLIDAVRHRIWTNPGVNYWYRQNAVLYVKRQEVQDNPRIQAAQKASSGCPVSLVHPEFLLRYADPHRMSPRRAIAAIPSVAVHSFRRRMAQLLGRK